MRAHDDDGATEDTYNDRSYFLSFLRRQVDGAFRKKKKKKKKKNYYSKRRDINSPSVTSD